MGMGGILTLSRQVRQGIANNTKGTAFVVYEDVMDAKQACDKLNGFNFQNRYLVGSRPSLGKDTAHH
jgi:RNA recognition motif-containing protein